MMGLFREMRRRHVLRIAGIYVAAGWVFIEVLANVLPIFEAPVWIAKTFTLLLLMGFPIAIIFTWAFDITPDGIVRTGDLPETREVLPPALPDYLIALALIGVMLTSIFNLSPSESNQHSYGGANAVTDASLAVLPFVDFSEGGVNQHLGNGIAEAVLNALSKLDGLQVASRTSSFASQHKDMGAREIGEQLGVSQILEGSIRRQGKKLRVSAQLSSVNTGFQIWSNTYDREFDDIFDIEEELARSLVVALQGSLALDDNPIVQSGTTNVEAYNLNLRGRYLFESPTQENFVAATQAFQRAIELDPDYGSAHGYLAFCLGYASIYSNFVQQVIPTAVSTELALRHDPGNIPATLIKGFMLQSVDQQFDYYKQALASAKDTDLALHVYANSYLTPQGRQEEGRAALVVALEKNPESILMMQALGMIESHAGNYDLAVEVISRAGAVDGSNFLASSVLVDVYYRSRNGKKLQEVAEQSIARIGRQNGFIFQYLLQAHILNGDLDSAEAMLQEMLHARERGEIWSATTIGMSLASLGRIDESTIWFVRAHREHDYWLLWHLRSAIQDIPALGVHPTIRNLLERMGLDDASIAQRIAEGR
jgi:TolB-like protein/tetratricopeptide (TPR) repeat protein